MYVGYRSEIDGLRAVAVIAVLLFHADLGCQGGFVGVDVFFTISGFLITRLIIQAIEEDQFSLVSFWERRLRRILPASLLVASVTLAIGSQILIPSDLEALSHSTIGCVLLVSNYYFYSTVDYFSGVATEMPLLHTWSLAIEEQFYLVYPLILAPAYRRYSKSTVCVLLVITLLASYYSSCLAVMKYPSEAYYWLPFRAWEILLGGMAFFATGYKLRRSLAEIISMIGIAGISYSIFYYRPEMSFPGGNALLPTLGAALFIFANTHHQTLFGKLLSFKIVVYVGLISYSLYLWHWPILAFLKYIYPEELSLSTRVFAVIATFPLASLSWECVEQRFRITWDQNKKHEVTDLYRTLRVAFVASAIVIATSYAIWHRSELVARSGSIHESYLLPKPLPLLVYESTLDDADASKYPTVGINKDASVNNVDFIVWGDSHAMAMGESFAELAREYQMTGAIMARSACPPFSKITEEQAQVLSYNPRYVQIQKWNKTVLDDILLSNAETVVLVARWALYLESESYGLGIPNLKIRNSDFYPERIRIFEQGLANTIQILLENNKQVWIVKQIPKQMKLDKRQIYLTGKLGKNPPRGITYATHHERQVSVEAIFKRLNFPKDRYIESAAVFFPKLDPDTRSFIASTEGCYYSDHDHLSFYGTHTMMTPLLKPIFVQHSQSLNN